MEPDSVIETEMERVMTMHNNSRSESDTDDALAGTMSSTKSLTDIDLRRQLLISQPANRDAYLKFKEVTVARLGIGRSGSRYLTKPSLRFQADHAAAQNAVFSNVSDAFFQNWRLPEVKTRCLNRENYLTRPDLGRQFDEDNIAQLKRHCRPKASVQIYIADGLSATAVETNAKDTFLAIEQGLRGHGIDIGIPFFLRYGRVPSMDPIAEVLQSEVIAVLIGERPGLATAESLSCYMAYRPWVGMPEANRTVISNIHDEGTPAIEAGAHIADVMKMMLAQKASGIKLQK
jgi:ethanolamine ammonia-lyase small subunit